MNVKIKSWTDGLKNRMVRVKEQSRDLKGKIKGRTTKKKIKVIKSKYEKCQNMLSTHAGPNKHLRRRNKGKEEEEMLK